MKLEKLTSLLLPALALLPIATKDIAGAAYWVALTAFLLLHTLVTVKTGGFFESAPENVVIFVLAAYYSLFLWSVFLGFDDNRDQLIEVVICTIMIFVGFYLFHDSQSTKGD